MLRVQRRVYYIIGPKFEGVLLCCTDRIQCNAAPLKERIPDSPRYSSPWNDIITWGQGGDHHADNAFYNLFGTSTQYSMGHNNPCMDACDGLTIHAIFDSFRRYPTSSGDINTHHNTSPSQHFTITTLHL